MAKNTLIIMMAPSGVGKAQPNDTLIPTPDGIKELGSLCVGDYVFDRRGNPTKVLGVFPQGELDCYEVSFVDGRKTYCNDQHLWSYANGHGGFTTKTLEEMMKKPARCKDGSVRYKIPYNEGGVKFSTKKFDIHPYIVGAFLGDGCCKEKPLTFSSNDEEIVGHIADLLPKNYSAKPKKNSDYNYNWSFYLDEPYKKNNVTVLRVQTKEIFKKYQKEIMVKASEKRIPKEYLLGDREQRLELLQGLLDTDGCIQCSNNRYDISFTSTSRGLVEDVQWLVRSLGFRPGIIREDKRPKYANGVCYNLHIAIPAEQKQECFYVPRKKELAIKAKEYPNKVSWTFLGIDNFKKLSEKKEMTCIKVDNAEELYLTNDFIVTHNTYLAKTIAETHEDCVIISRDAIRFALLKEGEDYFAHEKEVVKNYYDAISRALKIHKYVIADATHITFKSRAEFFKEVKIPSNTKVIGLWIETDLPTAIKQNESRTGRARVPEDVIRRMYKQKVSPREDEPFDEIVFISRHTNMTITNKDATIKSVVDRLSEL